jgi:hypothetical protein
MSESESLRALREQFGSGKSRPNHQRELQILRSMTPEQKLEQVFKLNERTLELMRVGLRERFPDLDVESLHKLYLAWRARCHNRNY